MAAKTGKEALEVFEEAMNNLMPVLEELKQDVSVVQHIRCQSEVRADRRQALALSLADICSPASARERQWKKDSANEIMDAANNTGSAVKRKEDMQKWQKQTRHCALQMLVLYKSCLLAS